MAGPEALLTKKVLIWLRKRPNSYTVKVAGGPHQTRGLPDVLHIEDGHLWAIEVKAPKGKATALQELTLEHFEVAGATSGVVRSMEELAELFVGEPSDGDECPAPGQPVPLPCPQLRGPRLAGLPMQAERQGSAHCPRV